MIYLAGIWASGIIKVYSIEKRLLDDVTAADKSLAHMWKW